MRLKLCVTAAALAAFAVGCSEQQNPTAPVADDPSVSPLISARGPVTHRVSVGSPDSEFFPPGSDANFSLVAIEYADGSVLGHWQDTFFGRGIPAGPLHIAIDCLHVDGNEAWVSGVITTPAAPSGIPVITRVADNGKSRNDPLDQISFSRLFDGTPCTDAPPLPLFDLNGGQVTVR